MHKGGNGCTQEDPSPCQTLILDLTEVNEIFVSILLLNPGLNNK